VSDDSVIGDAHAALDLVKRMPWSNGKVGVGRVAANTEILRSLFVNTRLSKSTEKPTVVPTCGNAQT